MSATLRNALVSFATLGLPMAAPTCGESDARATQLIQDRLPLEVEEMLLASEGIELLSLYPYLPDKPPEHELGGWEVLGSAHIDDRTIIRQLIVSLKRGIKENCCAVGACFSPRHGIRAEHRGRLLEALICFECLQVYLYIDDELVGRPITSRSPQVDFDRVLRSAGVPLGSRPN